MNKLFALTNFINTPGSFLWSSSGLGQLAQYGRWGQYTSLDRVGRSLKGGQIVAGEIHRCVSDGLASEWVCNVSDIHRVPTRYREVVLTSCRDTAVSALVELERILTE